MVQERDSLHLIIQLLADCVCTGLHEPSSLIIFEEKCGGTQNFHSISDTGTTYLGGTRTSYSPNPVDGIFLTAIKDDDQGAFLTIRQNFDNRFDISLNEFLYHIPPQNAEMVATSLPRCLYPRF